MIIGKGLCIKKYELKFKNLPPSFHGKRIAFLSDLHGEVFGKENEGLLQLIHEVKPSAILIGGDMVVGGKHLSGRERKESFFSVKTSLSLIENLSASYPIYHALGNHEEKLEEGLLREYEAGLLDKGVCLLDNTRVELKSDYGERIFLYGLSLGREYYPKFKRGRLEREDVETRIGKKKGFSVLLAHSPFYFSAYKAWGADLTLSGHLHGGIMRLPFFGGVLGPDFIPFPRYSGGLYEADGKNMIVSCGLGTHTVKLRIFNPPELTIIDLFGEK